MARNDRDLDAAERALEGAAETRGKDAPRRHRWDLRLAPLAELLEPVPPPPGLFDHVMRRVDMSELEADLARERRRSARWRAGATAAVAAAAALAILAVLPPPDEADRDYVAVVTAEGGGPALIVELDLAEGIARVRPVGVDPPASGSLELWHIEQNAPPRSLGLVEPERPSEKALEAAPGDIVAVSLEPEGGSPTGQPTGPVLFSGPLVAVE